MWKPVIIAIITLLVATSCTWVSLTRNGNNVRVVAPSEVQGCKKLGQTNVSLRDYLVGSIKRDEYKVSRELTTLGRNSAAEMHGDTIIPASEAVDGRQAFDVYKCMP